MPVPVYSPPPGKEETLTVPETEYKSDKRRKEDVHIFVLESISRIQMSFDSSQPIPLRGGPDIWVMGCYGRVWVYGVVTPSDMRDNLPNWEL
ncbi:hypothetical protein LENED_002169 [Lentinula edodes]|uniref:Uncharacterized protein n=1 Tax=Lentinula edodes TaxID=5353 RepID=A0A1Q3E0U7_LENED|nr:hypothetical protein LENED_002169 [Lentinula edodes]